MGSSDYNFSSRMMRTASFSSKDEKGNYKVTTDELFKQNKHQKSHESMLVNKKNKAHLREARDSSVHPNSTPIIIALDVTGSMRMIPDHLIREGLPKIVGRMTELGVPDPAICIMAVGDSVMDNNDGAFQLGQFESGDVEMDLWLERIWISKGGGGNEGESYGWPYFYALHHVQTDAWDKRKQKGFIFTIGDERCLEVLTKNEIEEYMGEVAVSKKTVKVSTLVEELKEKWNIFHVDLSEGGIQHGVSINQSWKKLIGEENVIACGRTDFEGLANSISETVFKFTKSRTSVSPESNSGNAETNTDVKTEEKTTPVKPIL